MGVERKLEAFDIVHVVRGDITGEGPLHTFPVAVRAVKSRRKRRQDIVHACLLHRRSARREMHPKREARIQAEWCRKSWLHAHSGAPSACRCGAVPFFGKAAPEVCPFCGEARG